MKNETPISTVPLTGIVLAGGRSTRMGEDKAGIPIHGVPMLQLVCQVAIALCDPVYVVTPWPERYQHILPTNCQFIVETLHATSLHATSLPHGPLVGFAQGIAQVKTEWVLLLACDLPRLRVEVLQDWANQLDSVRDEAIALLTRHAKGWDPLCGFYRRSCLTSLTEFINTGGRSFQQWLAQHPVQVLPLPDPQMLFNCNTPADLASLEKFPGC